MGEKFDWGEHQIDGDRITLAGYDTASELEVAEELCRKVTASHYENFLVANRFTPPELRQDINNVYAFSRYGDDLGDDAPFPPNVRVKLLDEWEEDLERAEVNMWKGEARHPILRALAVTARRHSIPPEPFHNLISAFRLDQTKTRYSDYSELREYCRLSADPVGHLYLYIYGYDDEELRLLSDCTCTALQLANHWQDVGRDLDQDRIYLPLKSMSDAGYSLEEYRGRIVNDEWRKAMQSEVERAQRLFDEGKQLFDKVDPRLAVPLRLFTLGGEEVLRKIRKQQYDTWTRRPRIGKVRQIRLIIKALWLWRRANKAV